MSNQTKLSKWHHDDLKQMRKDQENPSFAVFHFPEKRVTVGVKYTPGHNAARTFVSLASPEENKFRKKVGEYHVRHAYSEYLNGLTAYAGNPVMIAKGATPSLRELAEEAAWAHGDADAA